MHPFLDHPAPLAFAHRGGSHEAPENTLAAFANAVALGYRYVETDVRVTADGVLVLVHDPQLPSDSGVQGPVAALTWAELQQARVGGQPVVRAEQLLEAWPRLRLNIDVKVDAAVEPLIALLRAHDVLDRVCVGSFSQTRLAALRAAFGPDLCTSMGPSEVRRLRLAASGVLPRRAVGRLAACAQVPVVHGRVRVVDARFVRAAHALGIPVHVWTVDDPGAMHALLDLGADGLMTDAMTALRDVLVERGQWAGAA